MKGFDKLVEWIRKTFRISAGDPPKVELKELPPEYRYDALIWAAATRNSIPRYLLKALIYTESRFDKDAESPVGAAGLCQIMPATQKQLGISDPYDPEQSINGGAELLKKLWDQFGEESGMERWRYALACYNGGILYVLRAQKKAQKRKLPTDKWAVISAFLRDVNVGGVRPDWIQVVDYVEKVESKFVDYTIEHMSRSDHRSLLEV